MLVSQIAYNHLEPAAKAKCDALIAVALSYASAATSNFVTASVWADDFKSQLTTGTSHYIDLPFSLDGATTTNFNAPDIDVVQAINQHIAVLQNPASALTNQATSLRYLLHFVGDIQQPLHCVTAISSNSPGGDAGGNSFSLSNADWSNLHSLWDAGGGYLTNSISRPLTGSGQATLNAKAAAAEINYPYSANPNAIPDPMTWAREGLVLATNVSYFGITRGSTPTTNYLSTAKTTAEQRVALGGYRLADLLNTLFAPTAVTLTPLKVVSGKFAFTWLGISNTTYRVQWKYQLTDATWNNLTNIVASSNVVSFNETLSSTQRFYRVVQ